MQHPLEAREAKGSGRLLHLSLPGSALLVGESLTAAAIERITKPPRQSILLYPGTREPTGVADDICFFSEKVIARTDLRLIVLDATWRKSRKMLHLNPLLQSLPRLALHQRPPSRYTIRKAHQAHQLSTFEATCQALLQLGESPVDLRALLAAFDGFVAQQHAQQNLGRLPA